MAYMRRCTAGLSSYNDWTTHRYDRELVHGHWSAVRRVIDGRAPHSLVLRVASVLPADGAVEPESGVKDRKAAAEARTAGSTLLLTDGWHGVSAVLDADLQELVVKGSIRAGTTLLVCAATLEASVPPRLSLYFNSTFRLAIASLLRQQCQQFTSTVAHPKHTFDPTGVSLACEGVISVSP